MYPFRHAVNVPPVKFTRIAAWAGLFVVLLGVGGAAHADWREGLSDPSPGPFPALRPVRLAYQCGWSGLSAGEITAQFVRPEDDVSELDATASTTGLARALWRLDATHDARGELATLRPLTVRQKEIYRAQSIRTDLNFDGTGVSHERVSTNDKQPARRKHYNCPDLHDLQTAFLYVRSQNLEPGRSYQLMVYPGSNAYLATVDVLGRETIKVKAGSYPAIKLDLHLRKVNGEGKLEPHGKFKRATCWISDDANRLPLRINAQIFVGSVWVELNKVEWL